MKDNNNNTQFDNPEDILALLQDFQEDDIKNSSSTSIDTNSYSAVDDEEVDDQSDSMDDDLLALLNMITKQEDNEGSDNNDILAFDDQSAELEDLSNDYNNDELLEFSKLWETDGDFTINEPIVDDSIKKESNYDIKSENSTPAESSDIGDIFSDVLSVMQHENDDDFISLDDFDKLDFNNLNINSNNDVYSENQDNVDKEAKKKLLFSEKDSVNEISNDKAEKKSLLKKLFSKSTQEIEANNSELTKDKVKKTKKAKKVKPVKESNSNEQVEEVKKATKKAKKKPAKKTNKKTATSNRKDDSRDEDDSSKKPAKKAVKKDKKKTEKIKKAKKEVKVPKEETGVVEVDNSKPLNKGILTGVGVLVATIAAVVILGSVFYSESINTERASWNFEKGRYDEAYEVIQGQKITVDNKEVHEKITTVMYVNYFYNSYSSLYQLEMYPEALDSLLQGLRNYDRNIDNAKEIGIEKDMNKIRKKILKELSNKYNLSEESAVKLSRVDDKLEYSKKVHTIVGKQK